MLAGHSQINASSHVVVLCLCLWEALSDQLPPFPHALLSLTPAMPSVEGEHCYFTVDVVNLDAEPSMLAQSKHVISRYSVLYLLICDPL